MSLSPFQHEVMDAEFQTVVDRFKRREIDGILIDEMQRALREKLVEMADYEPAFRGMTVMVSIDPDTKGRVLISVRMPGKVLFRLVPTEAG